VGGQPYPAETPVTRVVRRSLTSQGYERVYRRESNAAENHRRLSHRKHIPFYIEFASIDPSGYKSSGRTLFSANNDGFSPSLARLAHRALNRFTPTVTEAGATSHVDRAHNN
jgi:hypothetical protein